MGDMPKLSTFNEFLLSKDKENIRIPASEAGPFLLCSRTIVALVYNVLKTLMEMNCTLFDELTSSYKADRQR